MGSSMQPWGYIGYFFNGGDNTRCESRATSYPEQVPDIQAGIDFCHPLLQSPFKICPAFRSPDRNLLSIS